MTGSAIAPALLGAGPAKLKGTSQVDECEVPGPGARHGARIANSIAGRLAREYRARRRPVMGCATSGGLAVGRREAESEEAPHAFVGPDGIHRREAKLEQQVVEVPIASGLA